MKTIKQIALEQEKRESSSYKTIRERLYRRLLSIRARHEDFAKKLGRDWILDTTEELMLLDDSLFKEGYAGQKLAYSSKSNPSLESLEISPKSHPRAYKLLQELVAVKTIRDARYVLKDYFEEQLPEVLSDFDREEMAGILASLEILAKETKSNKLVDLFHELFKKYFK